MQPHEVSHRGVPKYRYGQSATFEHDNHIYLGVPIRSVIIREGLPPKYEFTLYVTPTTRKILHIDEDDLRDVR